MVPEAAILLAVARLNSVTFQRSVQPVFLKWLVLVFPMLESTAQLRGMYGVLFLFLDYETLRPQLCQLMYMLTRRVDVLPFRIRRLLDLQKRIGNEPAVTALLSCYKLYCPHLVSLVVTSTRKRWFPPPDATWLARLMAVRRHGDAFDKGSDDVDGDTGRSDSGAIAAPTDGRAAIDATDRRSRKRARNDPGIPGLSATNGGGAAAAVSGGGGSGASNVTGVSLQQITSFKELLENLEELELPDQIAAVLASEELQHVLSCSGDVGTYRRLEYWLAARLTDEILIHP